MNLAGQTIIVTGAARGIGLAITEAVLGYGGNVTMVDLDADGLASFAGTQDPSRLQTLTGSVCDESFAAEVVSQAAGKFGVVNGLVNNAGIVRPAMIEKMAVSDWHQVLEVHLTGAFLFTRAICRFFIERHAQGHEVTGSIVNVSSDAGRSGSIGQINYATAKAGVLGMTMSGAREMARYGVRVNSVMFGVVETAMTEVVRSEKYRERYLREIPLGRWGTPAEVAEPVCFLLSPGASYITGQHISANGGRCMSA